MGVYIDAGLRIVEGDEVLLRAQRCYAKMVCTWCIEIGICPCPHTQTAHHTSFTLTDLPCVYDKNAALCLYPEL